jgi:glycosyltransferase 2 family protein
MVLFRLIMLKRFLGILKYLLFLGLGIFIFWWVYKDEPLSNYKTALKELNYFWVILSLVFNLFSQISRALRWNMLIEPLGYKPRFYNSYLSVLILYFVNLLLPRAGEVFRCTILSRYEKIPFTKLAGTVFVERLTDLIMLIVLAVIIIISQFSAFALFFNTHPEISEKLNNIISIKNVLIGITLFIILLFLFFLFRYYLKHNKIKKEIPLLEKIKHIKQNFITGIYSVGKLENKWMYIGHTVFIFLMWLCMLYVIFFAYEPTSHLSLKTGMITFLMGGLAMLAPVQGGIGPWHFMVYETLFIYGIPKADGKVFALIAHASTNLIYLLLGLLALLIIPIINLRRTK